MLKFMKDARNGIKIKNTASDISNFAKDARNGIKDTASGIPPNFASNNASNNFDKIRWRYR